MMLKNPWLTEDDEENQFGYWVPTPEQIAERKAAIRAIWEDDSIADKVAEIERLSSTWTADDEAAKRYRFTRRKTQRKRLATAKRRGAVSVAGRKC